MSRMQKRTVVLFGVLMCCMAILMGTVFSLTMGGTLKEAAAAQSSYKLKVFSGRGMVYDCNKKPITKGEERLVAAVMPCVESANALQKVVTEEEREGVFQRLTDGKPFLFKLPRQMEKAEGIDVFSIANRYPETPTLAHVLGYLNGNGEGVAGIEKAFDSYLSTDCGGISVSYPVDAVGRVLPGEERKVEDTSSQQEKGVVLTIDSEIQALAETAGRKYLEKGAVIVTSLPDNALRAVVSLPDFSATDVSASLNGENSPMLNRAFSAYNVGSVFKLVVAAAALESGISADETYECTGGIEVDGQVFHCFSGKEHGVVDLNNAIAYSCNAYFVQLAQKVGAKRVLEMAEKMGFGEAFTFAGGMSTAEGVLPEEKELSIPRALANFSFGQGSLMATPVQINNMVSTIAAGGEYHAPYLVEGLVDEKLSFTEQHQKEDSRWVMSPQTAVQLMKYMKSSVEYGTSKQGKPTKLTAGAKTATAETGLKDGDREIIQAWYTGFYPAENPRYVITILAEDGDGGGKSCGPVFQEITEGLFELMQQEENGAEDGK